MLVKSVKCKSWLPVMGGPTAVTAESAVKAVGPPITVFSLIRAARRSCGGNTVNTWTPRIHPIMATPTSTRLCSLCSRRRRHASCCCCLVPRCGVCGLDKEPETWHGVLPADSADVPAGQSHENRTIFSYANASDVLVMIWCQWRSIRVVSATTWRRQ